MAKKKKKKQLKSLPKGLPEKFLERLERIVGSSLFRDVTDTFIDKPTTFRVNTLVATRDEVLSYLSSHGYKISTVAWYSDAFILQNKSKRGLTELDIYRDGKIYIQSLASQVPPLVLDPQPGEKILDLTAAPGSKTSQIAALMQQEGELVANELNKIRFFRLKHNMDHLRVMGRVDQPSQETMSEDAFDENGDDEHAPAPAESTDMAVDFVDTEKKDWTFRLRMEDGSVLSKEYPEYFDKILVDAPCSGESRFINGYPKTYGYWSEHKIKQVAYRQHKLIMAAWSALKPGGVLVYSTCTIAPEENEQRVAKLLERMGDEAEVEKISIDGLKKLKPILVWKEKEFPKQIEKTLRIMPTKEIEGFFVARIRKKNIL